MSKPVLERPWLLLAIGTVIVLALLSTIVEVQFGPPGDPRPIGSADDIERLRERSDLNVLFVVIDTLRADRLGSYGYERDTSPYLDGIAQAGVRFSRHLSQCSWTKASMASLWTGLYPTRNGVTRFDHIVPPEAELPAEILKQAGFYTVGLYRNGWVSPNFGFDQGFDVYTRPAARPMRPSVRVENPTVSIRGTDEDVIAAGLEFLRIHGHERWFLYMHWMDVHEYIYDQESALFGGTYSDVYDNSIRWTDTNIGVLLEHLATEGYAENTLVIVTSDHGEAFLERGVEGHARRVFRESTEVPFFLSFPFRLESGVVVETRTRNVDVWPTVLDLLGLSTQAGIDGRSAVPEILASARGQEATRPEPTAVAHLDQNWGQTGREPEPTVAVAQGSYRYVRAVELGRSREQLFDAARDPRELEDRSEAEPELVEQLREIADSYLAEKPPWGAAPKRELGEMELNQLRALGYALP